MRFTFTKLAAVALVAGSAVTMSANGSPLPQQDVSVGTWSRRWTKPTNTDEMTGILTNHQYGGVTTTPDLKGLNKLLEVLQGSVEKITQALSGRQRRAELPGGDSDQSGGPQDPPELNLQDTVLSVSSATTSRHPPPLLMPYRNGYVLADRPGVASPAQLARPPRRKPLSVATLSATNDPIPHLNPSEITSVTLRIRSLAVRCNSSIPFFETA